MNKISRKDTGTIGEIIAWQYLDGHRYKLVEKNFGCKYGEVDIIVRKGNIMIFVEVKTRTTDLYGEPLESIGPQKTSRIRKISGLYLSRSIGAANCDIRFDIISIFMKKKALEILHKGFNASNLGDIGLADFRDAGMIKIEHIKNAF